MRKLIFFFPVMLLALMACKSDNDYTIPDLKQDICMFTWYGVGKGASFVTDNGRRYEVTNNVNFISLKTDTAYRLIITYVPQADSLSAEMYDQPVYVYMMGDSTASAVKCDTLNKVNDVWMGGGYLNLSLQFKHDGSSPIKQYFGYKVDTLIQTGVEGRPSRFCRLSPFYSMQDVQPLANMNMICSIDPRDLGLSDGDTLVYSALCKTKGKRNYTFIVGQK